MLAAAGYPAAPRRGALIRGLDRITPVAHPGVQVFHAGTTLVNDDVAVSGGRVLCVTALGDSVRQAQQRALDAVRQVRFEGAQWRNDIGHRAIRH